jgi:hypothetical protein
MARPTHADRGAVADANLSVRLTGLERARWDAFVARQSAAFRGTGARVTAASLARDVLVARLDQEGIPTDPAELAAPAAATPMQEAFWPAPTGGATAGPTTPAAPPPPPESAPAAPPPALVEPAPTPAPAPPPPAPAPAPPAARAAKSAKKTPAKPAKRKTAAKARR